MNRPYIYIINLAGCVVLCLGQGQKAVEQAVDYLIRRQALKGYLSLRQGLPSNVYEPLRIMARSGRPLVPGDAIARPTHGKWRDPQGQYKTRR